MASVTPPSGSSSPSKRLDSRIKRAERAHRKSGARRALAAVDAAAQAAETELSRAGFLRDVDNHVNDRQLPPLVTRFLDTHWRSYLVRLHRSGGEPSRGWNEAVKTMNDLTWAVRPKTDEESRRRLFELLPQLFQQLHDGLRFRGVDGTDQDAFFAELSKCLQAVLNPASTIDER